MIAFDAPWLLLGLLLLPIALRRRRNPPALPFSDVGMLRMAFIPSLRQRLLWLPPTLRLLWVTLLVIAIAGPVVAERTARSEFDPSRLFLVLDCSGSMAAPEPASGRRFDRLKSIAARLLEEMPTETRVGIVAFSRMPRLAAPLTADRLALRAVVDGLEIDRLENRTNLGDALLLAVEHLGTSDPVDRSIVLVSDGSHNVPEGANPGEAARIASALAVRVQVVGIGSPTRPSEADSLDEQSLRLVAEITGGRYWPSDNVNASVQVADGIGEQVRPRSRQLIETRWRDGRSVVLLLALTTWLLEAWLRVGWLRVRPNGDSRGSAVSRLFNA